MLITPVGFGALAYSGIKLPDDTPLKPFEFTSVSDSRFSSELNGPKINPDFRSAGIYFEMCNTSTTTSHRLDSISMRISSLTPYTGQLNEWPACTAFYTRSAPHPVGCGGGEGPGDEDMLATFPPGSQAGAVVQLTQVSWDSSRLYGIEPAQMGPLPITLGPGEGLMIRSNLAISGTSGTYGFTFGLAFDGSAPAFVSPMPPIFLAPIAHTWSGDACKTAAMQAQIPPDTNPPTYYLCPNA
jgi:hypothetical protein